MNGSGLKSELERLHPVSFGWALACCSRRREEAEDILQMTYVKVLDGRARFDGRSSLKTWLFAVIRRTAAEHRRRRWLRDVALLRWLDGHAGPPPAADPEGLARLSEESRALLAVLEELPRRQRELLHLVFYQDLTIDEASRVLGVSVGTARTHFDRGKKALRRRLAAEGWP